jgi:uncharacterized membrane protein
MREDLVRSGEPYPRLSSARRTMRFRRRFKTARFGKCSNEETAARSFGELLRANRSEIMGSTTKSIEVDAPLQVVYNQWTQFETFPQFMEGVEEVRQEGDRRLFWRARIGGKEKSWEARITDQVPDACIAWESITGARNAGVVVFEALNTNKTRVSLTIDYEPEGMLEKTGDAVGVPAGRVEGDLRRFRDFIEARGRETGAWRGQIRSDSPRSSGVTAALKTPESQRRSGDFSTN